MQSRVDEVTIEADSSFKMKHSFPGKQSQQKLTGTGASAAAFI
jgi:hypothetical protein